jgi:dienelactone hydrolase
VLPARVLLGNLSPALIARRSARLAEFMRQLAQLPGAAAALRGFCAGADQVALLAERKYSIG